MLNQFVYFEGSLYRVVFQSERGNCVAVISQDDPTICLYFEQENMQGDDVLVGERFELTQGTGEETAQDQDVPF